MQNQGLSRRLKLIALTGTMLVPIMAASSAHAQIAPGQKRLNLDENGVDLATGNFHYSQTEGAVGSGISSIGMVRMWDGTKFTDGFPGDIRVAPNVAYIRTGQKDLWFNLNGTTWESATGSNETLTGSVATGFTLTYASGLTVTFSNPDPSNPPPSLLGLPLCRAGAVTCFLPATSTESTAGADTTLEYDVKTECDGGGQFQTCEQYTRLTKAELYSGAKAELSYGSGANWSRRTQVELYPAGSSSAAESISYSYPATRTTRVTDADGDVWEYKTNTNGRLESIKRPDETTPSTTIVYDSQNRVTSITRAGSTTTYTWSASGGNTVVESEKGTGTEAEENTVTTDPTQEQLVSVDPGSSATTETDYSFDGLGRITKVTSPEGNYLEYERDAATGEVLKIYRGPKGGGAKVKIYEASYITSCASLPESCRRKEWEEDADGNRTNYTYDARGQLTKAESPAAASGQPRPTVNFSYSQHTANSGATLWRLDELTFCRTAAACAGTANEQVSTYTYRSTDLLLESVTVKSGDSSVAPIASNFEYDAAGRLSSIDGPLPGNSDTVYIGYNGLGDRSWTIGPDPDGAGPRPRRFQWEVGRAGTLLHAIRFGYTNATTINGSETVVAEVKLDYSDNRLAKSTLYDGQFGAGGVEKSITQYSYNSAGQIQCTVQRNKLANQSLGACSGGSSSLTNGPDQIARRWYNNDGTVRAVTTYPGDGTYNTEYIYYTDNGQVDYVRDADGNKTDYTYDSFDRLYRTNYPVLTVGAGTSSTTDFEQFTYNSLDHLTTYRDRAGANHTYAYDDLGRLTTASPAGKPTRSMTYDLAGSLKSIQAGTGTIHNFIYDALGRQTYANIWNISYQYDTAGRRSRITHNDGNYFTYEYDDAGNLTHVKENGSYLLARFEYDSMGRRSVKWLNDGSATAKVRQGYTYNDISQLTGLASDIYGSTSDLTKTFTYTPAGQIASTSLSKDEFVWQGASNLETDYISNGLNQYDRLDPYGQLDPILSYDARGNLTGWTRPDIGPGNDRTYTYDSENFLTNATMGGDSYSLSYDPLGRLRFLYGPGNSETRFVYDGLDLIAELDSVGQTLRRYVFSDRMDEPLVWYEGASVNASSRRFLATDERGSIQSVTADDGTVLGINAYGSYGEPDAGNLGRFGYTGQTWLSELELNYYKARFYSTELGRYLQVDPIGYGDGLNTYNYVASDPINLVDPLGLHDCPPGWIHAVTGGTRIKRNGDLEIRHAQCVPKPKPLGEEDPIIIRGGCNEAQSRQRANLNAWASEIGPVTFDSESELALLRQYFEGDTTPYTLSDEEWSQAQEYVGTYGEAVLGPVRNSNADGGLVERSIYFGAYSFSEDAPLLDGLLGTATGYFDNGELVAIVDTFNFDFKDRGGFPSGWIANLGVFAVRVDAATCAGNVSIPVGGS